MINQPGVPPERGMAGQEQGTKIRNSESRKMRQIRNNENRNLKNCIQTHQEPATKKSG